VVGDDHPWERLPTRDEIPLYVAGCPQADTLEKGSGGGGCSKEGVSHPMTSRQPGAGLSERAHGAERHREGNDLWRLVDNRYELTRDNITAMLGA
jgi:hypothetical protein